MSHFSVMVIGENVDAQLGPFHEFECTGRDDRYVQDVNEFDEMSQEYNTKTMNRLRDPQGNLHAPHDEKFYRDPTAEERQKIGPVAGSGCGYGMSWSSRDWGDGQGYRTRVKFIPDGWTEVEVPVRDLQSFVEWVADYTHRKVIHGDAPPDKAKEHKWGWISVRDGEVVEVVRRTNPNARWDWYQIGGRFAGRLILRRDATVAVVKPPNFSWGWSADEKAEVLGGGVTRVDSALKRDIDFAAMRDLAAKKAGDQWDTVRRVACGLWEPWEVVLKREGGVEKARVSYHAQPPLVRLRADAETRGIWEDDAFLSDRVPYVQEARDRAVGSWGMVHNGKWSEQGKMGWWATSTPGELTTEEWYRRQNELVESLPDDTRITIVDCHT